MILDFLLLGASLVVVVADLEIGEASNELIHMIGKNLEALETFSFKGENLTYSGIIGLSLAKKSLKNLSIKNPKITPKPN